MDNAEVNNWFGDLSSRPRVVVEANSVDDIINVLKDPGKYPSPIRAVGSIHSTTPCGMAEGGTILKMKTMNKIINISNTTLTVQAGAQHIDMAKELEKRHLQFYVNTEIGNLTAGSAACAGTKDSSFPGEYGQVGSYIIGVKMVRPDGELMEITESQPELMQKIRSSYGTFGIIYEVTYSVRPLTPMAVYHETFNISDFAARLDELKAREQAMMYFLFPFENKITVEFRLYNPGAAGDPDHSVWFLRNYLWATVGPRFGRDIELTVPVKAIRYKIIDGFSAILRWKLENLIKSDNTSPPDEIIDYPEPANDSRYTFSLFAFPETTFPDVIQQFYSFVQQYYQRTGYRSNLLDVGYRISKDQKALLSYSYDGPVMTLDPVSTGNPGWPEFLGAYNEFCSDHDGCPLLNQTFGLTQPMLQKALGDRLKIFAQARKEFDPKDRLLNDYFRTLLS